MSDDADEDLEVAAADEQVDAVADAQAAIDEARRRVAEAPAEVVVTNHVMGLYELAAIHLSAEPADLRSAALAIDAVACLVDGLGDRLGPEAPTLRDALANIRLAFVEVTSGDLVDHAPPTRPAVSSRRRRKRPIGASTTRPARTVTPSARSSAACPAAGSVAMRPSLRTTRHHGSSRSGLAPASRLPTARARPGNPASSATSP